MGKVNYGVGCKYRLAISDHYAVFTGVRYADDLDGIRGWWDVEQIDAYGP